MSQAVAADMQLQQGPAIGTMRTPRGERATKDCALRSCFTPQMILAQLVSTTIELQRQSFRFSSRCKPPLHKPKAIHPREVDLQSLEGR